MPFSKSSSAVVSSCKLKHLYVRFLSFLALKHQHWKIEKVRYTHNTDTSPIYGEASNSECLLHLLSLCYLW